ncbi:putative tRNA pseudouridine synthase [Selaginella moellendorffii]|uniref:putative tRNA pseudouridine synthase n=1 Tax=Selaginella moellendorffii TaxID=88036 RepID=UPI000D1C3A3A|nr:putative tRNA pseudouridine synthase [Selaginella moellendorffii]|eukprot:XP_024544209.1 putative tRNA pseudouridine synthase [Selaginella moellendorffii]
MESAVPPGLALAGAMARAGIFGRRFSSGALAALSNPDCGATRKKKVAMWIGYVGTGYKGLQLHGDHPTIEADLDKAIYKAGGILDSNYGHHMKVGWARSSRTDKGVHSLATVISLKMELPIDAWRDDPGGIEIADRINRHLPQCIRVFGVVPVSKTFRPRMACSERSYDYFLPALCVGINQRVSTCEIKQLLEQFRLQLKLFEGEHPFHNYTIRRNYGKPKQQDLNWRTRTPIAADNSSSSEEEDEDGDADEPRLRVQQKPSPAYWLQELDPTDRITSQHYRKIIRCSCGDIEKFGDTLALRVSVTGASFMVHQIRKMIGTAVAVTRKLLPPDIIQMSLCRHSRIVLPIAPCEGLTLASSKFCSQHSTSHAINLSSLGCQRREAFWKDHVFLEIVKAMKSERDPWNKWCEAMDSYCYLPEPDVSSLRDAWLDWKKQRNACLV